MREYFCAYHSMLDATRKLSDAEVGRLFRGLLHYSATGEQPENLQGREEIVFDIFSQQIDREAAKYESKCKQMVANGSKSHQKQANRTQEKDKDKDKEKDKDKDKGGSKGRARARFTPPTVGEVADYASQMGYAGFGADRFVDYYTSKGWLVGKSPMKDWRAAVRGLYSRDQGENAPVHAKNNPAQNYEQREYRDEDFGDDFFVDLEKYREG